MVVIESDGRDHGGKRRPDHVGAVQQTAHAGFQHDQIAVCARVDIELQRVDIFKFRDDDALAAQLLHQRKGRGDRVRQRFFVDHLVVDLDPLTKIRDIRRDEQAGFVACRRQNGGQNGANRAFSVGAGNMDVAQLVLRIAHAVQQRAHAVQSRT